jgi:ABC-type lipoprotein release transport system permease subunit
MDTHHRNEPFGSLKALIAAGVLVATAVASAQTPDTPPVLVTRQLAEREGLSVGEIVQLSPELDGSNARAFRVTGIYEPVPDPMRLGQAPLEVRLHLPDLQALTRDPETPAGAERVDQINVALVDPSDAPRFVEDLNGRNAGIFAMPVRDATGSAETFVVLERFHYAIAAVTIIAATVFLLALTIMLVDERRETVGVLRLIGLPSSRILVQVFLEGVMIAAAGAVFGLLLAVASESLINRFFQWRYDTALVFVRISLRVAVTCVAIAVPLGAAATVAASWALLRRNALRLARR